MGFDAGGGPQYGNVVGGIFVFNLIVGVGALSLPNGFAYAGLVPASLMLVFLAFLAFMTVTFLIESMSIANAVLETRNSVSQKEIAINTVVPDSDMESSLSQPLLGDAARVGYSLDRRVEIGQLSEIFLGKPGQALFFITIIVYLLGDLAIYATTIADAVARVTGGWRIGNVILSDTDAYYVYVLCVLVVIAPLGFLNFNSPWVKYLQFATMAIRNFALLLMISLTIDIMAKQKPGTRPALPLFRPDVPALFGTAIYAFMCHHSLPGIVTPMKDKLRVIRVLMIDFSIIAVVYILLGALAVSCFGTDLSSLYIYKFKEFHIVPLAVFLQLFPVFTLASNFPLLTITLRNNMIHLVKILMGPERVEASDVMREPETWFRGFIFTLSALAPAFIITMFDNRNVTLLVRLTGSYPGLFIMFVFPAVLVFCARRYQHKHGLPAIGSNPYRSWFQSKWWLIGIAFWCVVCLILQTYNLVVSAIGHGSGGGH
jgi:amino acid permease